MSNSKSSSQLRLDHPPCNLCGGRKNTPFLQASRGPSTPLSATSQAVAGEQLVRCSSCGLIFTSPRPPRESIFFQYSQEKDYLYLQDAPARTLSFRRSLKTIGPYCLSGGRLLDVGCAAGFFLKVAQDQGFQGVGVEPNHFLASWGTQNLGLTIYPGSFENFPFSLASFDLITFWDVLEHLPDPLAALKKAHRLLRSSGILAINYPNISSPSAKLFGKHWWFVTSGHLYYFNPQTISQMLQKTGFQTLADRPHWQTLSLAYLFSRLGRYQQPASRFLWRLSRVFGAQALLLPYRAGQRLVIARKTSLALISKN